MSRTLLTKLHLAFAAFMFPAVLMFLVTGALYTWGNKGPWIEQTVEVGLEAPMAGADQTALMEIVSEELTERDIPLPSGKASVSGEGEDTSLSWTGARSDIVLSATADPTVAELKINEASFHRWLVQLHKAKGSTVFKVYATFLAISLFLLVASGLIMGFQVPAMRKLTIWSSVAGFIAFVGFVLAG